MVRPISRRAGKQSPGRIMETCYPGLIMRFLLSVLGVCLSLLYGGSPARALESAPVSSPHATVTLMSDADSYTSGHPFRLGLQFRMAPGWHIYGKDPGDSGLPPELTFTLPSGVTAGPVDWPPTMQLKEGPLTVNAYQGTVVLPVTIDPHGARGPIEIDLQANWLICQTICVPEEGHFHLTLLEGQGGEGSSASPLSGQVSQPQPSDTSSLPMVLLFAVLGGLILNLMPCVFPVLAMKALALARLGSGERAAVRSHAVAYTAGVLLAFLALGLMAIGLRHAGAAVGWGFQFASPVFVTGMAWLLMAVGLNLSGVYQIGARMVGTGHTLSSRDGLSGSFFTGLLAVVVATPCTAPFMGLALAVALNAPAVTMLTILLAMGLGLALPYLLVAIFPQLVAAMPKPGSWMEVLKQALAFPVYASVCWLVWVIAQEAGSNGVLIVGEGLTAIAFAAWVWGIAQFGSGVRSLIGRGLAILAIGISLLLLQRLHQASGLAVADVAGTTMAERQGAEPFSRARLDALRAEGRPVFVNLTAAWCVTCLVNEQVALSNHTVKEAFRNGGVAYLLGDWTRQDRKLTAFLRDHGRDGVPLYLFYPAGGGDPVTLPQLLTPEIVINAVRAR
ncbi:Thiol:disulfide interchange protein DsbD [Granulibacter bethesdensis CGDNIH4]|nr:Thiol:disulfide interchange protein DsbD [Granulibacter bethesdensis CGDNIH4]